MDEHQNENENPSLEENLANEEEDDALQAVYQQEMEDRNRSPTPDTEDEEEMYAQMDEEAEREWLRRYAYLLPIACCQQMYCDPPTDNEEKKE